MMLHYVLADGEPVGVTDVLMWARWYEGTFDSGERRVAEDTIGNGVWVSTVFLGTDYDFVGKGPPVLWETAVFEKDEPVDIRRYSSREDAERGHREVVAALTGAYL